MTSLSGYNLWVKENVTFLGVQNNIFGDGNSCVYDTIPTVNGKNDNNNWWVSQSDADCNGPNDAIGAPGFGTFWHTAQGGNIPLATDFQILDGSPPDGVGDTTLRDSVCVNASDYGEIFSHINNGNPPNQVDWEKCLYWDFGGNVRSATAPDAGAWESI